MKASSIVVLVMACGAFLSDAVSAEPVAVRFAEGVARGFPVLRAPTGEKLAQGDLVQIPRGNQIESRLTFRYADGSYYEERAVFSQDDVFTLRSYRIIQRGPSFPETIEAAVERKTGRYQVRYKADSESAEEFIEGRIDLPPDTYNGLLTILLKNLPPGVNSTVNIVAFTPKPRIVKVLLTPAAEETILVGDVLMRATRFLLRPQLGLFASLLVTDLPDVKCWILGGDAPAFLKFEGPLYFMGPIWRIELN